MAAAKADSSSSAAETEPLEESDTEVLQSVSRGRRPPRTTSQVSTNSDSRDALDANGEDGEEEEPLPKEYGRTRPLKDIKARRRAAGSESSLTSQSDSDSTDRPLTTSTSKVQQPRRRAGLRKTAAPSAVPAAAANRSDASDVSEAEERESTSPEAYRPRVTAPAKTRRRRPPVLDQGQLGNHSDVSALPTPIDSAPPPSNGRKRRRGEDLSGRSNKSARLEKTRSSSPVTARGKFKASEIKLEEVLPVPDAEEDAAADQQERDAVALATLNELFDGIQDAPDNETEHASEPEDDPVNDAILRARMEAMEELVRIEIKFSKVREALYLERSEVNAKERQTIEDGTHLDLQQFTRFLADKQASRLSLARQMYTNTEHMIEQQIGVSERNVWRWWENARLLLRTDLLLQTQRKRRRYDRDRTFGSKWDKAEESDKYREIYEDHMHRRTLTEELAEAELLAENEARWSANGISPLSAAAIQTDLEAMSIRTPSLATTLAYQQQPLFAHQPGLGPYQQVMPSRSPLVGAVSAPAPYIAAASTAAQPYVPPPRAMPSPLSAAPFEASTSGQTRPDVGSGNASVPRTMHSPTMTPASPIQGASTRPVHAHRPSLDDHMERKSQTPNPFQNRFVLPPIPPYSGGTKTHSGMAAPSTSTSAPATPTMPPAVMPTSTGSSSGPASSMMVNLPEIPPFRAKT